MTDLEILATAIHKAKLNKWNGDYLLRLPESFIFDHDFAKALWGECTTWVKSAKGTVTHLPLNGYQYHLQQMILAREPIKYLGKHI